MIAFPGLRLNSLLMAGHGQAGEYGSVQRTPMDSAIVWGLVQIVPHIQSSTFSFIGQNATIANVYKGQTHVGHSRLAARFDPASEPLVSASVGKRPLARAPSKFSFARRGRSPAHSG